MELDIPEIVSRQMHAQNKNTFVYWGAVGLGLINSQFPQHFTKFS